MNGKEEGQAEAASPPCATQESTNPMETSTHARKTNFDYIDLEILTEPSNH
eukprot:m.6523 g.6523  ORF g.6523 m.6523 type:complete len:51 (+) comp16116_c0_seq2:2-154(+)